MVAFSFVGRLNRSPASPDFSSTESRKGTLQRSSRSTSWKSPMCLVRTPTSPKIASMSLRRRLRPVGGRGFQASFRGDISMWMYSSRRRREVLSESNSASEGGHTLRRRGGTERWAERSKAAMATRDNRLCHHFLHRSSRRGQCVAGRWLRRAGRRPPPPRWPRSRPSPHSKRSLAPFRR